MLPLGASTHDLGPAVHTRLQWKTALHRTLIIALLALVLFGAASSLAVVAVVALPPIPVAINGTVGNGADAVEINGQMTIATRIIPDPDFNGPTVLELIIDFSSVKGNGKAKGQEKFSTEAQTIIHRPLLALDPIEVTFPYNAGNSIRSAKTAKATLMVGFDARTGINITSTVKDVPLD